MEILLAALVSAAVATAVVLLALRTRPAPTAAPGGAGIHGRRTDDHAVPSAPRREAEHEPPPGSPVAPPTSESTQAGSGDRREQPDADNEQTLSPARRDEIEDDLRVRREELARLEERVRSKEQTVDLHLRDVDQREQTLDDRQRNLDQNTERLKEAKKAQVRELERVAGLSAGQAKQILMRELEDEVRHDSARLIRRVEEETRHDADRRARSILAACMQRVAGGHAIETTVSVVELKSDELKGRIIGREGRNIRTLETLTGIDFIIDDTPGAVLLSGFDGVRREIARLTLERLLQDGRIHPARIEEAYGQAKADIDKRIVEVGEQAVFEANVGSLHPELTRILGRLHFRTSYGQNVLAHSIECARLGALLAAELGANARTAARAALLHDIGKAVSHEIEGPHALVGGQLARRHQEAEAVAHAMESHHNEVEPQTVEAVIVQIADSTSGARPGARGASLERYVTRLHDLESVATRHAGVEKVYAMHAGREIRVIVRPEDIDDDSAALLSHTIARDVERELEYPGQIKVTVIRESRATDYAK
ncbi:MAG: ribonuclease Y [Thermoleophilaceae bacterium]|nr:ribonuclease Y [Thermoleophilaceae bacterium]